MRRAATVILVLIVVLVVGGVVLDRLMVARTEDELLATAREHVELADDADVVIDGFPFLTQVLAGRLAEVRGESTALVTEGMELRDVRVTARGVQPEEPYRAETVEINAEVPVATLRSALADAVDLPGDPLSLDVADGVMQLGVDVAGLELTALVDPVVVGGAVALELGEVMVAGASVPRPVVDALADQLGDVRLEIPGLPDGLVPTRLAVGADGLEVRLAGTDVELGAWMG
ncbi:DUF2993 domain-containing protein [Georgenia sp. H159]|uniref:LmeA family phospholipid-binding protein n=1 Tax=Georgenia sp. H159 TaxID=3076115 RepID=UPI002D778420|nr:DUF2993 domain-containing protein [Georgenia sp. H159]